MKIKILVLIVTVSLFLLCCANDSGIEPMPGKAVLITPENAKTCEEGAQSTATESTVTFSWNGATDAQTYDLKITNLTTQETISQKGITATNTTATLKRGNPYSWTITALSLTGKNSSQSETWKFYLSGTGVSNYAPFPAQAISPLPGSTITPTNKQITLKWDTSDVDGDALTYTLYCDKIDGKQTPPTSYTNLSVKTKDVVVDSNTIYYWRIVTSDGANTTPSVVYSFKTN